MMPGMDGFTLVKTLREDPRTNQILVLMLPARASEEDRIEGLRSGGDDYLVKPFSAQEFLERVRAQLKLPR
jgi:DNA-binding response OmpR family regulator